MATKTPTDEKVETTVEDQASDTVESGHRGRTAEPFAHTVEPFRLTISFHDEIDEDAAGKVISGIIESLSSVVDLDVYSFKRVTRGEPSFYQQTYKVAGKDYEWSTAKPASERGIRTSAETRSEMDRLVESIFEQPIEQVVKRTGKTRDQLYKDAIAAVLRQTAKASA